MVVAEADVVLADAAVVAADVAGHSLGLVDEYYSPADECYLGVVHSLPVLPQCFLVVLDV